jgi:release factor glutamine methyltransferase
MTDNSSVSVVLRKGAEIFREHPNARLDSEILLAHVLSVPRIKLYTDSSALVTKAQEQKYIRHVEKRSEGVPIPYITGYSEFWSLPIIVTKDVLIPRPETELLVEIAKELSSLFQKPPTVADAGTGSGAIAAAYAKEHPNAKIVATDTSTAALAVAKRNFDTLNVNHIELVRDDWLTAICNNSLDMIITNPPYVDASDTHLMSLSTSFEPTKALYAENRGMSEINKLIRASNRCLKPGGFLLVEHGFAQKTRVVRSFLKNNFVSISTRQDLAGLDRVTYGQKICIDT